MLPRGGELIWGEGVEDNQKGLAGRRNERVEDNANAEPSKNKMKGNSSSLIIV